MHVRITTITGASDIDAGLDSVRQRSGYIRGLKGNQGISVAVDRADRRVSILSVWDSEADIDAADADAELQEIRAKGKVTFGAADQTAERFEVVVPGDVPPPGSSLLTRTFSAEPGRVDQTLERFRTEVLPDIQTMAGFVTAAQFLDRAIGRGLTATVWTDDASAEAANKATQKYRDTAEGVIFDEPQHWEIVYNDA